MARPQSKIMSIAEKKEAQANLATASKAHQENVKALKTARATAKNDFDKAVKEAHAPVIAFEKQLVALGKARDKALKDADKAFAAAIAKLDKADAAAAKGTEKFAAQTEELKNAPVAKPEKAPKAPKAGAPAATE
mgnify:CR=1 FL=1